MVKVLAVVMVVILVMLALIIQKCLERKVIRFMLLELSIHLGFVWTE